MGKLSQEFRQDGGGQVKRLVTTALVALLAFVVRRRELRAAYEAGRMEQYTFWTKPYPGISVEHYVTIDGREDTP